MEQDCPMEAGENERLEDDEGAATSPEYGMRSKVPGESS
jgi:hypothetical protein